MFLAIFLIGIGVAIGMHIGQWWEHRKHKLPQAKAIMMIGVPVREALLEGAPVQPALPAPSEDSPAARAIRAYCDQVKGRAFRKGDWSFVSHSLRRQLEQAKLTAAQAGLSEDEVAACQQGERELAKHSLREYCESATADGVCTADEDGVWWHLSLDQRLAASGLASGDIPLTSEQVQACRRSEHASEARHRLREIVRPRFGRVSRRDVERLRELIETHGLTAEQDLKIPDTELCWIFSEHR